jgi:hypothetical protein
MNTSFEKKHFIIGRAGERELGPPTGGTTVKE